MSGKQLMLPHFFPHQLLVQHPKIQQFKTNVHSEMFILQESRWTYFEEYQHACLKTQSICCQPKEYNVLRVSIATPHSTTCCSYGKNNETELTPNLIFCYSTGLVPAEDRKPL